ncbi:MAG TPA: acyltransferase family protein [Puia sp.]|nr:acyltransferase family protein [Puia sp.]
MKRNLYHIDEVRFLIIHLILFNHWAINLFMARVKVDFSLVSFFFELTSPCLAIISGYLFFYRTKEKFDFLGKLRARVGSLIVPYVFWTITFFLAYYAMKEIFIRFFHATYWYGPVLSINLKNFVYVFKNPPLVNFWYLQNLVFIIPFNFIIYFFLKNKIAFIAVFLFIIAAYAFSWFGLFFQPRFLPFYLLGCFMGYHEVAVPKVPLNMWATGATIIISTAAAAETIHIQYTSIWAIVLKIVIATFFLVAVYNLIDAHIHSRIVKYLQKNKTYSFFLFAINMFLFGLVQRFMLKIGLEPFLINKYFTLLFNIVSFAAVLTLALSIGKLLKSKVPDFYHFITGR